MRYAVIIERARGQPIRYVPDLPGCIATAASVEAAEREIHAAIQLHIEGLHTDGSAVPQMTGMTITVVSMRD